jgi:Flp pilus assembly pilin Flp
MPHRGLLGPDLAPRHESGASMLEYGLVLIVVAAVALGSLGLMAHFLDTTFVTILSQLEHATA